MTAKIFIDGEHGTTGLQIRDRLAGRTDIDLLSISHDERRDQAVRERRLREADVAILCLPDDAARESVAMAKDAGTRFIDASTAHRTAPDWVFGFAELEKGQAERIAAAQFVSNPGCYSTGAIALLKPLVDAGIIPDDYPVSINAVSGYTGGGKSLIAQMEDASREDAISANHYAYALTLAHKHIPEIFVRSGLKRRPIMTPNVGRFPQGMLVNDHESLTDPSELVRLQDTLKLQFSLTGKPVYTTGRKRIGKVEDFSFDKVGFFVQKLYVGQSLIKNFSGGSATVDRTQIVEITDRRIVVKEATAPQKTVVAAPAVAQ